MRTSLPIYGLLLVAAVVGCGDSEAGGCGEGFEPRDGRCVPICGDGFELEGDICAPICAAGFERQGVTCIPVSCVEECEDHERCEVGADAAECKCVPGYEGDPCTWGGGLQDVEFKDGQMWSGTNGATVLPLAQGQEETGIASFESSVVCSAGAVSQIIEMPEYQDAEPFAIEILFRSESVAAVEVGYGRAFRTLPPGPGWVFERFCLGEEGYGGPVKFQVAASEPFPDCFFAPAGRIEVDRFAIVVADEGECPAPGSVSNGAAEVGEGGWVFEVDDEFGAGAAAEASLQPEVGESGSSGARIFKPAGSEKFAAIGTRLSVPRSSSMPSPALRFWWQGSKEWSYYADLGTYPGVFGQIRQFDVLFSDGTPQVATYCLPPWTHGNVVDLMWKHWFGVVENAFEVEAELIVDNVEIISDPRCGDSSDLLAPGFEISGRWPGVNIVTLEDPPVSSVKVIDDPARAHSGTGLLELTYTSNQHRLEAQTWVWVPPSEENRGPALVFYSNVPADPGARVPWTFGTFGSLVPPECIVMSCPAVPLIDELPKGGGWRRNELCLPSEWSERWFRVRLTIRENFMEPLEVYDPPRAVLFDDFELTTSEACPTQPQ